jgi:hypothetical protein
VRFVGVQRQGFDRPEGDEGSAQAAWVSIRPAKLSRDAGIDLPRVVLHLGSQEDCLSLICRQGARKLELVEERRDDGLARR